MFLGDGLATAMQPVLIVGIFFLAPELPLVHVYFEDSQQIHDCPDDPQNAAQDHNYALGIEAEWAGACPRQRIYGSLKVVLVQVNPDHQI